MATMVEIRCIRRKTHDNPHERITHVGGVKSDGQRWQLTQEKAIEGIEDDTWDFYVNKNGVTVGVIVATRSGRKYLKTKPDGEAPNNLLNLPDCP